MDREESRRRPAPRNRRILEIQEESTSKANTSDDSEIYDEQYKFVPKEHILNGVETASQKTEPQRSLSTTPSLKKQ